MKKNFHTKQLTMLGLLTAVLLIMAYTPLGYLNIGPLAITLNIIPVALAAITLGPMGGAVMGCVFGLTSFLQCIGVGGSSAMGVVLFGINPFYAFLQRFIPRVLNGLLLGYLFRWIRKISNVQISCFITGFCSAFLNTAFFMTALILLFGNTDYMREMIAGKNIILFVCTFVGINAVFEMMASTIITGLVGFALFKAKIITVPEKPKTPPQAAGH